MHHTDQADSTALSNTQASEITLAVLPFENLTEESGLNLFCQSFCTDLITELSRFKQFQIIAYDSIRDIPSRVGLTDSVVQNLHSDYLVRGSFRSQNGHLRINTQLIKSHTRHVVWADRFEGAIESILEIQEDLLRALVATLQQQLNFDLRTQFKRKNPKNLKAYEYWLSGMEEVKKGTLASDLEARKLFQQAIDIDPGYSLAYSGMSLTYFNEWSCQLWDRWEVSQKGAYEWAKKAIELDEQNHVACVVLGRIHLFIGEYDTAEHYLRKALRLNPNDADSLISIASCFVFLGYPGEAEKLYQRVIRLNPLHIESYNPVAAFIYFELGDIVKSVAFAERSNPTHWVDAPAQFAAMYYLHGDYEKMQHYWNLFLSQHQEKINCGKPATTDEALNWVIAVTPFRGMTRFQQFWDFIREGKPVSSRMHEKPGARQSARINAFVNEGEIWRLTFNDDTVQMPEVKGFFDILRLLQKPGEQIHCSELMGAVLEAEGEPVFDEKAKKAYHKRILQLQEDIHNAESENDTQRAEALQKEYDQILSYLSRSLGLEGKTRQTGSPVEKARTAVTWRIRNAIKKIESVHPPLGRHLSASIKTGTFCIYQPENQVDWTF